jgi:hypothetical protein
MADLKTLLGESYKEGMTVDEINTALSQLDLIDTAKEKVVKKDVFDKTASELAAKNKLLKDKMTEDEQRAERDKEIAEQLKASAETVKRLTLEKTLSKSGFDDKQIANFADAFVKGDTEELGKVMTTLITDLTKKVKDETTAELLKTHTHTPPAGNGDSSGAMTKEQFDKMGYIERVKLQSDKPDLYKEFTKTE